MRFFEHLLSLSWEHYYTSSSRTLTPLVDDCLRSLTAFANDPSSEDRQYGLTLLCQFYQLSGVIARDQRDIPRAIQDGKKAVELAFAVDNVELIAASLFRRAKTYVKQTRYDKAMQDFEAALLYAQRARDPLKTYIHQATAEASLLLADAHDQQQQSHSLALLDTVEESIQHGQHEDDRSFVRVNSAGLAMDRAHVLSFFKQPHKARQTLSLAQQQLGPEVTRWQVRLLITDAEIALAQHEVLDCCDILLKALNMVRSTGSRSHEQRIEQLYHHLITLAPDQSPVRSLGEYLHIPLSEQRKLDV